MTASDMGRPGVAFAGSFPPTRPSVTYRIALLFVAIAMLVLPAVYAGVVALAAAAVWWHLTSNTWMLGESHSAGRLLLYLSPAVVGGVLTFFMVKPILARPARPQEPLPLDPESEAGLFAFIADICRLVRAPMPARVQVDCQVNASAGFEPGLLAMLRRDLVLTIGLPLVGGLTVRQLGGVLAHEFGHFAQGGGMRVTNVVRSVNLWFSRVVYGRDAWDEKLEEWSRGGDFRLMIVLLTARGAVWASRRLLAGLMMAGHAISCFMLRQMEYDADSYEVKVAGSETFVGTVSRLREMSVASQIGYAHLRAAFASGTMPSNLPAFLADRTARLPDDLRDGARAIGDEKTGVWDTHPSDADRVRAARALALPGVLVGGDGPASTLFRGFDGLSTAATRHHYQHDLGLDLDAIAVIATDDAVRESTAREDRGRALEAFFGAHVSVHRPLRLPADAAVTDPHAAMLAARATMRAAPEYLARLYREFEELEGRRALLTAAQELFAAGFTQLDAEAFGLRDGTQVEAREMEAETVAEQQRIAARLEPFESAAATRLACALAVSPDAIRPLADAFVAVATVLPEANDINRRLLATSLLEENASRSGAPDQLRRRMFQLAGVADAGARRLGDALRGRPSPDGFFAERMDLAARCGVPASGTSVHPGAVVDRTHALYWALLGGLAAAALEVEAASDRTGEVPGIS